jgi:MFS family permease
VSGTPSSTESSSAAVSSGRRLKILDALGVRDFAFYFTGRTISYVGDGVMRVALPWQVYELSNVPTAMAVVAGVETAALVVFLLYGGVLADRIERRRIIVAADLLRGAAAGAVGLLAILGTIELWHIVLLSLLFGVGRAFAGPATGSVVPDLVPPHLLVQANSALYTVWPLSANFAGPAIGGAIVAAFGAGTAFLLDGVSFFAAVCMLGFVGARPAARILGAGDRRTVFQDVRESFGFVRAHSWLWGTLLWSLLVLPLTMAPYVVLLPYLVKNELGGDAQDLGLVYAVGGLSGIAMSLAVSQFGLPRRHMTFMWAMFAIGSIDLAVFALTQEPWHAMLVALFEAAWFGGILVWNPLLQRAVPNELLGRVRSVDWLTSIGLVPVSYAIIGPVADAYGVRPVLLACGAFGLLLTLGAYFLPGMLETEGKVHLSSADDTTSG